MFSWEKSGDRVAIVQMNAELRHAQLELLSAQCAADRLRLRFSAEDIAQHAQRDVLRKAVSSARVLNDYYGLIAQHLGESERYTVQPDAVSDDRIEQDSERLANFFREQREFFLHQAQPLSEDLRQAMAPFFSLPVLDKVRIVALEGTRIATPALFSEVRALGFTNLPDLTHMRSVTFGDVVVFQEPVNLRQLFHALVHVVQFEILGLRRYAELFIRAFVRTRSYVTVPLETHALILESKYIADRKPAFSVEEKVQLWTNERRYQH